MRLRRTALPSAFFMLQPKRLRANPFGRKKTVNSRSSRRRPLRYTASYSARRTSRDSRGKRYGRASDAGEIVASLSATTGENLSSARLLHSRAKPVLLVSRAHVGLIGAFRQRFFSSGLVLGGLPGLFSAASSATRLLIASRTGWPALPSVETVVMRGSAPPAERAERL